MSERRTAEASAGERIPPTSVIICTRDRPELLSATVESVLRGDVVPAELVVVDQSREPHRALAAGAFAAVRYVHSATRGLCRARNLGLAESRYDVVAFLDDDVLVDPGWLRALVGGLGAEDERRVTGGQVIATRPERPGAFASSSYVDAQPRVYEGRIDRDPLGGGNMATYRSAIDAVGSFDERLGAGGTFPAADDNDLGLRLLEAGYKLVYVPEAVIHHRAWRPRWDYPLVRWRYGRGKGGFYAKHRRLDHVRTRAGRDVRRRLRRLPRLAVSQPGRAVGDVVYVAGVALGVLQWLTVEERRRSKT